MADNDDQSRSDNKFYMGQLHARACKALNIDPDRNSWFDIVDGLEAITSPPKKVLGYTPKGDPIYPCEPGRIYTACFISCSECGNAISAHGGPSHGATCVDCYSATKRNAVVHYGLSKAETNSRYGSAGVFNKPTSLCGKAACDVDVTRSKQEVTCNSCKLAIERTD